ncbi:MAG: 16S rRNA (cytosine(1402)-N(4))-methyltransferase RsmH [Polyangiaceae bacterium]
MSDFQLALNGLVHEANVEWIWSDTEEETSVRFVHATVMKFEVVNALAPKDGGVYVDVTLGGGGHTEAILRASDHSRVIAFDRDPAAIEAARARLLRYDDRITYVPTNFGRIGEELRALGIQHVDGLCADLGVSSPQLDDASRGMSFRNEGPIDMRMDPRDGETALELIHRLDDDELADVIYKYGEEGRSRRIARSIKKAANDGELETTVDLRRAIVRAVGPARVGGVDPATRTFQALRIMVNAELEELETLLAELPQILRPGGNAAILSFHSLEDRLVKRAFHKQDAWRPHTKKPEVATDDEMAENPRSRSAKLRAAERLSDGE